MRWVGARGRLESAYGVAETAEERRRVPKGPLLPPTAAPLAAAQHRRRCDAGQPPRRAPRRDVALLVADVVLAARSSHSQLPSRRPNGDGERAGEGDKTGSPSARWG